MKKTDKEPAADNGEENVSALGKQPEAKPTGEVSGNSSKFSPPLRRALFWVVLAFAVLILVLFVWAYNGAADNYDDVSQLAKSYYQDHKTKPEVRPDVALLYTIQAARAQDILLIKAGGILLGFLVTLIGSALTLTGLREFYKLKLEQKEIKSAIETSSPGLVLTSLGVLVVVVLSLTTPALKIDVEWIIRDQTNSKDKINPEQKNDKEVERRNLFSGQKSK